MPIHTSIQRFQKIHTFFNGLFIFWIIFTIALIPLAILSPSTFKFTIPLELKEQADTFTGNLDSSLNLNNFRGQLSFENGPLPSTFYYHVGIIFIINLFLIFILLQLKKITTSVIRKTPFELANKNRLKYMGIALILLAFFKPIVYPFLAHTFNLPLDSPNCLTIAKSIKVDLLGIDWLYLTSGFVCLLLAEVFRVGNELKQETELTI